MVSLGSARLVGRGDAVAALDAALQSLHRGPGGIVAVAGDPGMGKTRLLREAARRAYAQGLTVRRGRARETAWALHPFMDALPHSPADAVPRTPPPQDGGKRAAHALLRGWLADLVAGPTVYLLDDFHWADSASVELLEDLTSPETSWPGPPVLLVVAYRPRQAPGALRYALACGEEEGTVTRLRLGPLTEADAATLVGLDPSTPEFADLYVQSEGNPLHLRVLHAGDAGCELLLGEVTALAQPERVVALALAVLPEPATVDAVADVADLPSYDVARLLGQLCKRDVVRTTPQATAALRHATLRDAIYQAADPLARLRAHERAYAHLAHQNRAGLRCDAPGHARGPGLFDQRLDDLTTREREVAHLVGAGHSNQQIAHRLRLSVRTVEAHLANIYRKLDVRSRVHLSRLTGTVGLPAGRAYAPAGSLPVADW